LGKNYQAVVVYRGYTSNQPLTLIMESDYISEECEFVLLPGIEGKHDVTFEVSYFIFDLDAVMIVNVIIS